MGAGITGLIIAWKLVKAGREVTIIERDIRAGGLAKTIEWNECYFDNGAHNFFTRDPTILEFYQQLLPGIFLQRKRNFRLYIFGRLLTFPFLGIELLLSLKSVLMLRIITALLWTRIKSFFRKVPATPFLDEWIIAKYGKTLYDMYFEPYLERIQRCNPHRLSSVIGRKKIPRLSLRVMTKEVCHKIIHPIPSQKKTSTSFYCKKGYGTMPMFFLKEIIGSPNVSYHSGETVKGITISHNTVVKLQTDQREYDTVDADVISTIPLAQLCNFPNPELQQLTETSHKLQYTSMRFFFMKIKKPRVTGYWIVNFNDERMPFYRVAEETQSEFEMVQEGFSSLSFEIPFIQGDLIEMKSDAELLSLIIERFNLVFPLSIEDVLDYRSLVCDQANPRLVVHYREILEELFRFIFATTNLYSIGRQGFFTYANLDHCTRMALDFSNYYLMGKAAEGNKELLRTSFNSGL